MQKQNHQKIQKERGSAFRDAGRHLENPLIWENESMDSSISKLYSTNKDEARWEESDVIQETVKTFAKQIPQSPINLNFKQNPFFPLKEKKQNNPSCSVEQSQLERRHTEVAEHTRIDRNSFYDRESEQNPSIQKQYSQQKDYFVTQPAETITSQASFFKDKKVEQMYDKENSHSGWISSYKSIQPKSSLMSSLSSLSHRLLDSSKSLYNQTFLNRRRCKCDINLAASETCSLAFNLLNSKYKKLDKVSMKQQYYSLLSMSDLYDRFKSQIDKDVLRTYPEAQLFQEGNQLSQELKNVLYAFSVYDMQIGYVQGMNLIVGAMLYHAEEYLAFWMTCMIFESLEMRDIFLPGLPGLRKHVYLIDFLMWKHTPFLHQIFNDNDIRIEDLCSQWILSLGAVFLPLNYMTRLVQMLMKNGWSYFYRMIISYILFHEDKILKSKEPEDVLMLLAGQSYSLERRKQNIEWDSILQSAERIQFNEAVVHELLEKFDIEKMATQQTLEFKDTLEDEDDYEEENEIQEQKDQDEEIINTYCSQPACFFRNNIFKNNTSPSKNQYSSQ